MGEPIAILREAARATPDRAVEADDFAEIETHAAAADRGEEDLAPSIAILRRAGILARLATYAEPGPDAALVDGIVSLLRRIGRANLSVGRLVEGHLNALRLVALYASPLQRASVKAAVADGAILGVWGADGARPLTVTQKAGTQVLSGEKRFASGLGVVSPAIVSVRTDDGPQLYLVPADLRDRMDMASWTTSGMKATLSGTYTFDGVALDAQARLGDPGDWLREPHFEGGVWRYCALHVGGMEALAECARRHAKAGGFADEPITAARLADLAMACETGRLWVEAAARRAERPGAGDTEVAYVLLAREAVERACLTVMETVDRLIGAASFFEGHPADRIRRDLGFFLRQANLDGKRAKAAERIAASDAPMGEIW